MEKPVPEQRLARLRDRLRDLPCDTLWIVQPENRRYLSGFTAADAQITESSGSLLIRQDAAVLVTDSRYATAAAQEAAGYEVFTLQKDLIEDLPGLLKRFGTRKLGFEGDYLTWGLHRQLSARLAALSPAVEFLPQDGLVEDMRLVKDEAEILALSASAALISSILDTVVPELSAGLSEKEVAWRIRQKIHAAGADGVAFPPIVASGPNAALPHAEPGERRLRPSEPIILDVGLRLRGYCSDITRTVFLGAPSEEFRRIYEVVRRAQLAALSEVRAGVQSSFPDQVARNIIAEAGYGEFFGHALGHGVGLATHERPRLSPRKPVELKRGMVATVEPGIYVPGKGGVRLEEMVLIENGGARVLTPNRLFYDFSRQV